MTAPQGAAAVPAFVHIHLAYWQLTTLRIVVLLAVLAVVGVVLAQVLGRVFAARMGRAAGPAEPGPGGSLQPLADVVKAAQKEDGAGTGELGAVLRAAPVAGLAAAAVVAALVPAGPRAAVVDTPAGTLVVVAALLVSCLAGALATAVPEEASAAGVRQVVAQVLAAAPVLLVAVVAVAAQAGTFSLQGIVRAQAGGVLAGVATFGEPFVVPQILAAVAFAVAQQGLRGRRPFLAPGPEHAAGRGARQLTGLRLLLFHAAGLAAEIAVAGVAATLFLGGWALPGAGADDPAMDVAGPIVLAVKVVVLLVVGRWIEAVLPRVSTRRFVALAHRVLLPLAGVSLCCTVVLRGLW